MHVQISPFADLVSADRIAMLDTVWVDIDASSLSNRSPSAEFDPVPDDTGKRAVVVSKIHWRLRDAVPHLTARSLASLGIGSQGLFIQLHLDRFSE